MKGILEKRIMFTDTSEISHTSAFIVDIQLLKQTLIASSLMKTACWNPVESTRVSESVTHVLFRVCYCAELLPDFFFNKVNIQ